MEETLNHLEKVIRDVPNGSQEVEPINHIEKVIQEVGQEVIGMIPSPSGGSFYTHHIRISTGFVYASFCFIIIEQTTNEVFTSSTFAKWLYDNGFTSVSSMYDATGYYGEASMGQVSGVYSSNGTEIQCVHGLGNSWGNNDLSSRTFRDIVIST